MNGECGYPWACSEPGCTCGHRCILADDHDGAHECTCGESEIETIETIFVLEEEK